MAASAAPRQKVIIDTDPGIDDALAILLALASPELEVLGFSISPGNGKDIAQLGANALLLQRLARRGDIPVCLARVAAGDPAMAPATESGGPVVHGHDGLGGVAAKYGQTAADKAQAAADPRSAPELIYELCKAHPGEVTLICLAPLVNVAAALEAHPDLPGLVKGLVIMGGAVREYRGNRTPAAEANFDDDPLAAQLVLTAGFKDVVLAPLDVTHQTDVQQLREACRPQQSVPSNFVYDVCQHYIDVYRGWGNTVVPAHDALPVAYLLKPELFEGQKVRVEVETEGRLTKGMSVADWRGQWGKEPNCTVLLKIDNAAFIALFADAISRLPLPAAAL